MTKDYKLIVYNGKEAREYPDGTIRNELGHAIAWTPEKTELMIQSRRAKKLILTDEAIRRGTNSESADEGVVKILEQRVKVAMEGKERASNDAAKIVLQAGGYLTNDRRTEVVGQVNHVAPQLSPKYLEYLERLSRENIVDATAEDVDDDD